MWSDPVPSSRYAGFCSPHIKPKRLRQRHDAAVFDIVALSNTTSYDLQIHSTIEN